jgi:hypothetical protein
MCLLIYIYLNRYSFYMICGKHALIELRLAAISVKGALRALRLACLIGAVPPAAMAQAGVLDHRFHRQLGAINPRKPVRSLAVSGVFPDPLMEIIPVEPGDFGELG